jgi:hypothetical protein
VVSQRQNRKKMAISPIFGGHKSSQFIDALNPRQRAILRNFSNA